MSSLSRAPLLKVQTNKNGADFVGAVTVPAGPKSRQLFNGLMGPDEAISEVKSVVGLSTTTIVPT
jgi:hypothetical protein